MTNWINFVKEYQSKNNISFKKAIKEAGPSYRKMKESKGEVNKKIKIIKDKKEPVKKKVIKIKKDKKEPEKKKVIKIIKDKKEPVKEDKKIIREGKALRRKRREKREYDEQQAERERIKKIDKKFQDEEDKRKADFKEKKEKERKRIEQLNKMSLKEIKAENEKLKKQLEDKKEPVKKEPVKKEPVSIEELIKNVDKSREWIFDYSEKNLKERFKGKNQEELDKEISKIREEMKINQIKSNSSLTKLNKGLEKLNPNESKNLKLIRGIKKDKNMYIRMLKKIMNDTSFEIAQAKKKI